MSDSIEIKIDKLGYISVNRLKLRTFGMGKFQQTKTNYPDNYLAIDVTSSMKELKFPERLALWSRYSTSAPPQSNRDKLAQPYA